LKHLLNNRLIFVDVDIKFITTTGALVTEPW
jgi:hypothetical protein